TYNTLRTSRGGQTSVALEDGSKVWLNAASSLRFPVAFTGTTREVEVTGEAYFEIAKHPDRPFIVHAPGGDIRVLGTSFNINAYTDEPQVKTTLVDGAVQLMKGDATQKLRPGQEEAMATAGRRARAPGSPAPVTPDIRVTNDADLDGVLAWKNGWFQFDSQDVPTTLRNVGRWYDVEVAYSGEAPKDRFSGIV